MAHYVYQCIISQGTDVFAGYGITENEEQRRATHTENLTEKGFALRDWVAYPVPSKAIAVAIEKKIKDETRTVDIKVDGFRTECAPIEQHGYISSLIFKELASKSASSKSAPAEEPSEDHYSDDLSEADRTSYEANVRDWESLLESVWGGRIMGETNRNTAKEFLADSLEALRANSKKVSVYLPEGATHTPKANPWRAEIGKRVRCKEFKAYNGEDILEFELNAIRRALHDINWEKAQAKANAQQEEEQRQRQLERERKAAELAAAKKNLLAAQEPRVQKQIERISSTKRLDYERWYGAYEIKTLEGLVAEARAVVEARDAIDALLSAESSDVAQRVRMQLNKEESVCFSWSNPNIDFVKRAIVTVRNDVERRKEKEERSRQEQERIMQEIDEKDEGSAPRKKFLGLF